MNTTTTSASTSLSLVPPPPPLPDLTPATLSISLSDVDASHYGRKLRVIGQILWFDPLTSFAILTSPSRSLPHPTLLVNLCTPLLGSTPSIPLRHPTLTGGLDLSSLSAASCDEDDEKDGRSGEGGSSRDGVRNGKGVNREPLVLARGEWVRVVGWLEGAPRRVKLPSEFATPPSPVLEAIFVLPARAPPDALT